MDPRVSVQIIAKETTPLGKLLFSCCLQALHDSDWADEIILVNDGCSADVIKMVEGFDYAFQEKGVKFLTVLLTERKDYNYSELRQAALDKTGEGMNVYHWVDTDEVYFPDHLSNFKETLRQKVEVFSQAYTYFYHMIFDPRTWQFKATKDNIFGFNGQQLWSKGVHEKVVGIQPGSKVQTNIEYLHFGYLRPQWQTCLKWLHYDMIEHGHVDGYKDERLEDANGNVYTKPWFRDWRTPNTILDDRRPESEENGPWPDDKIPDAARPIFEHTGRWDEFLLETEDHTFWKNWESNAKAQGSWKDTLDIVIAAMTRCGWAYDGKVQTQCEPNNVA